MLECALQQAPQPQDTFIKIVFLIKPRVSIPDPKEDQKKNASGPHCKSPLIGRSVGGPTEEDAGGAAVGAWTKSK